MSRHAGLVLTVAWDRQKVGPRSIPADYTAGLGDPAKGEKVPRCRVCGMPSSAEAKLIVGVWTSGVFSMRVVLCEREIPPLDPRAADPLSA